MNKMIKRTNIFSAYTAEILNQKAGSFFSMNQELNSANKKNSTETKRVSFFQKVKNSIRKSFTVSEFLKNPIIHWLLAGTVFLNVANWILLAIFIHPVDFKIIFHYNVYFGVDLIGDWWQPYILPLMGVIFLTVNCGLAVRFYRQKERIASYILLLASLMVQIGLIIASSSIILINY